MITLNYEQNYNKPHWFILAFAFYSAFTEKAQNARHAISHLETIMSQQISYSVSQCHYGYCLHNTGMSVVISTLQYIYVQIVMYLCGSYLNMITCFSVSSHLLFGVITSAQKVSYYVRRLQAMWFSTDHNSFQIWDFI